jgi:hypothetical protein
MNWNDYKYIVSSGCSYGAMGDLVLSPMVFHLKPQEKYGKFENKILDTNDKIISINLSISSQSSSWQSDSIIHAVSRLIEFGIKKENIYCFIEWSQWDRISIHPMDYLKLNVDSFNWIHKNSNFGLGFVTNFEEKINLGKLLDYINIAGCLSIGNVARIDDRIYMNPSHTWEGHMNTPELKFWHKKSLEYEISIPTEEKLKLYLDNILKTQYFLKLNDISYNCIFMQGSLTGFLWEDEIIKHNISDVKVWNERIESERLIRNLEYNPIADKRTDIEIMNPHIKFLFDKIDFNNFWFYENEKYHRGGIDEYALDTLGECGYISNHSLQALISRNLEEFNQDHVIRNYNYHPNEIVYILLWNIVSTNCNFVKINQDYLDLLLKKYYEDVNHDGVTKNGITISKKYLNEVHKNVLK